MWDVPLVSTLRSPMFGFTADDLAAIRRHKSGFFYDALAEAAKEQTDYGEKCRGFYKILTDLRDLASEIPTDELIWQVLDRTGARGLFGAMEEGAVRVAHLLSLIHISHWCSRQWQRAGFHA